MTEILAARKDLFEVSHNPDGTHKEGTGAGIPYVLVRDEKADTTDGGTFTSGAWRTRDLNTKVKDTDSIASIAANQITLPAGKYYIQAQAPGHKCASHRAKLRNITSGADLIVGENALSAAADAVISLATVSGYFTLTVTTAIELQHQCQTTRATDGFGAHDGMTLGVEIYSKVEIWQMSP